MKENKRGSREVWMEREMKEALVIKSSSQLVARGPIPAGEYGLVIMVGQDMPLSGIIQNEKHLPYTCPGMQLLRYHQPLSAPEAVSLCAVIDKVLGCKQPCI
jgi:hypothetical protein